VNELMTNAAWYGELATLHPLFVGAPAVAAVVLAWAAFRRRGDRRAAAGRRLGEGPGAPGRG